MAKTHLPLANQTPAPLTNQTPVAAPPLLDFGMCMPDEGMYLDLQDTLGGGNSFIDGLMGGDAVCEEPEPAVCEDPWSSWLGEDDGVCDAEPEFGLDESGELTSEDPVVGVCEDEPQVCVDVEEQPDEDVLAAIREPLNYGVLDWAITDADARSAMSQLDGLPAEQRTRILDQLRESGHLERLLDNLSDEDKEAYACTLGRIPAEDRINELTSYGILDWAVTDAEASEALTILASVPPEQVDQVMAGVNLDRLLANAPDDQIANLRTVFANSSDPALKARVWAAWASRNATARADATGGDQSDDIASDMETEANGEVAKLLTDYQTALADPANAGEAGQARVRQQFNDRINGMDARKTHELDIELQHDVRITNEDANRTWTDDELTQIGATLDRLPPDHVLGNDKIVRIHRDDIYVENGTPTAGVGGTHSGGVITIYDSGVNGGYRATGDRSEIGDHNTGGAVGHRGLSPLEETLAHEIGHDIHDIHDDVFDRFQALAGWQDMDRGDVISALQADGMSEADAIAMVDSIEAERSNPDGTDTSYQSRHPRIHGDWVYEVDPYSGDFLRRRAGFMPGDDSVDPTTNTINRPDLSGTGPNSVDNYEYAASNYKDHFAEMYSHMVHIPETVHNDYVEEPQRRLDAARQAEQLARDQLTALQQPGSGATADQLQAAQDAVTAAERARSQRQGQFDAMSGQWNLLRTEVFGVTPEIEANAQTEISTLVAALPPDQSASGQQLAADFERDLQRAATPQQIQQLRERYQQRIRDLSGVCEAP